MRHVANNQSHRWENIEWHDAIGKRTSSAIAGAEMAAIDKPFLPFRNAV
jgi:hypothetical protein